MISFYPHHNPMWQLLLSCLLIDEETEAQSELAPHHKKSRRTRIRIHSSVITTVLPSCYLHSRWPPSLVSTVSLLSNSYQSFRTPVIVLLLLTFTECYLYTRPLHKHTQSYLIFTEPYGACVIIILI